MSFVDQQAPSSAADARWFSFLKQKTNEEISRSQQRKFGTQIQDNGQILGASNLIPPPKGWEGKAATGNHFSANEWQSKNGIDESLLDGAPKWFAYLNSSIQTQIVNDLVHYKKCFQQAESQWPTETASSQENSVPVLPRQRSSSKEGWADWQIETAVDGIAKVHGLQPFQAREVFDHFEKVIGPVFGGTSSMQTAPDLQLPHVPGAENWGFDPSPLQEANILALHKEGVPEQSISPVVDMVEDLNLSASSGAGGNDSGLLAAAEARALCGLPPPPEALALDADPEGEPLTLNEYAADIFRRAFELEREVVTSAGALGGGPGGRQPHVSEKMRAILVDWLVELHLACNKKYRLSPETLHLAVQVVDRVLAHPAAPAVTRKTFQLLGVAAFLVASKYEDIYPPYLEDLTYYTDSAYTGQDIMDEEARIAALLKFRFSLPTAYPFLLRFLKAGAANKGTVQLANYFSEQALHEAQLLDHAPSRVAACCVWAARKNQGRRPWTPILEYHSGYTEEDLKPCLTDMTNTFKKRNHVKAVHRKFGNPRFGSIATQDLVIL